MLSHRQRRVLSAAVCFIRELNVILTNKVIKQRGDRNVTKHVFVKMACVRYCWCTRCHGPPVIVFEMLVNLSL